MPELWFGSERRHSAIKDKSIAAVDCANTDGPENNKITDPDKYAITYPKPAN